MLLLEVRIGLIPVNLISQFNVLAECKNKFDCHVNVLTSHSPAEFRSSFHLAGTLFAFEGSSSFGS